MAIYKPSEMRQQKGQTTPREPSLVPIMNLFLGIIPFMMMMVVVSATALVELNFTQGGGGDGPGGGGGGAKVEKVEVQIWGKAMSAKEGMLGFQIREPGVENKSIPAINQIYDFISLENALKDIRSRKTDLKEITVLVYPDVLYGDLMRTIDLCKTNGFTMVHYTRPTVGYY